MKKKYFLPLLFCLLCASVFARPQKTLLVINSYNEGEPWANDIAQPIAMYLAAVDSVNYEIANLENAMMTDSVMYRTVTDNIFRQYEKKHPSYIVMIGNLSFNLRERIKEEWGDVPMLLISRTPYFGNLDDYYTTNTEYIPEEYGTLIESVRNNYNMTAAIIPDYSRETVDLMVKMNPNMKELVFLTTNIFVQRRTAAIIAGYINTKYRNIKFRLIPASEENAPIFQSYIIDRHPETGVLIGSWVYEKMNSRGTRELTANDLRLMASSKTPIFAMLEVYRSLGCLGGVFINNDKIKQEILGVIKMMMEGRSMRTLPFITSDEKITSINYRLLGEYDIPESLCPEDTEFISKPQAFWERYFWQMIVGSLIGIIVLGTFWWRITFQKKEIQRLNYTKFFLNNMPVPYAQADIIFNKDGSVENIAYTSTNIAFDQLIKDNAESDSPFKLFPADFIAEKTSEMIEEEKKKKKKKKKNVEFNYHFDKTDTYYEFILCAIGTKPRNEFSLITTIDIFARDITKNLKMENQIRRTADKLDLSLRVSQLVPWQWYVDRGKIVFDDRDILGRTKSYKINVDGEEMWEIAFSDFLRRIHPDDVKMFVQLVDDLHKHIFTKFTQQVRMKAHLMAIEYDWVEITAAVTSSAENGDDMIVTGSLRIITESRQQEENLRKALAKAQEADHMKSAFLANMSHEIRTPLNAIVGFSNILAEAVTDDRVVGFKEIINRNNELLLSLIGDVLDLAKIESNTIDLHLRPTDINKLVTTAEQTVRIRLQQDVILRSSLGLQTCVTEADHVRVSQVLINFLTNACKFTSHGKITCGYELRKDYLYFYVMDTGIGLSKEEQEKVFGRFVKLNNIAQGTGLGLAISKRLVEIMGGEIGVESDGHGFGSTFWFTLPYKPCTEPEKEETKNDAEAPQIEERLPERVTPIKKDGEMPTLLIAEDNDSNFILMEQLLKNKFNIIHAFHGGEALTRFKMHNPDVILMDISMPYVDGYEATRRIREISKTVPIIAVTAYAYASDYNKIMQSGFNGYIAKPLTQKALYDELNKFVITS